MGWSKIVNPKLEETNEVKRHNVVSQKGKKSTAKAKKAVKK